MSLASLGREEPRHLPRPGGSNQRPHLLRYGAHLNRQTAKTAAATPQMATTSRSCHAHGDAPGLNGAKTALMKCRMGKKLENWASPDPSLIGNHSPPRNSRTKNTTLITGPAASGFGITVLMAAPSA